MNMPKLSVHFESVKPSDIRLAQIEYMTRTDDVKEINIAIGNVSLPMYPAMQARLKTLATVGPFKDGVVKYSATVGYKETNDAFLNIIASSGFQTDKLFSQITDGGSQAMELAILGVCGPAGTDDSPLLLIDAAYTNYSALAQRLGRKIISVKRHLEEHGKFSLPEVTEIEQIIKKHKPGAMVIIPYDNPTGQFYDRETFIKLAKVCADNDLWIISDEAYRELHYVDHDPTSIWGITNDDVNNIEGRRISIETASKVWNACGLRIGALVTDNKDFHEKAVAENTANLCSNVIGQYIFGALAHESHDDLRKWYDSQRRYYRMMLVEFCREIKQLLPGIIVSSPDASIYSVIDVRNIAKDFDSLDFVLFCAQTGKVNIDNRTETLLVSPMKGFYNVKEGEHNPGKTQMRLAYVAVPEEMKRVPKLFAELFNQYNSK
ncbi:aminotransferase class I/II-fold pyridoxal phosphate-dependent enzyme [Candidatus Woesearchaeota archaeon]|nr:aminotransferase class I/II-fold pyridoxal phosphate-dependent enzyme [Candidatus Woesearchaeota archaeon]